MEKIFWADLEMTGLDPKDSVIIEFAGIVTDLRLKQLDHYEAVVFQPQEELDKMDEWNQNTHGGSGLLARIPKGKQLEQVEDEVLVLLNRHFEPGTSILAGNSIYQDRRFIDEYMPRLSAFLHYRMLDVSSFKQVFKFMYGVTFEKGNSHRAMDDITESIGELAHYLEHVKAPLVTID